MTNWIIKNGTSGLYMVNSITDTEEQDCLSRMSLDMLERSITGRKGHRYRYDIKRNEVTLEKYAVEQIDSLEVSEVEVRIPEFVSSASEYAIKEFFEETRKFKEGDVALLKESKLRADVYIHDGVRELSIASAQRYLYSLGIRKEIMLVIHVSDVNAYLGYAAALDNLHRRNIVYRLHSHKGCGTISTERLFKTTAYEFGKKKNYFNRPTECNEVYIGYDDECKNAVIDVPDRNCIVHVKADKIHVNSAYKCDCRIECKEISFADYALSGNRNLSKGMEKCFQYATSIGRYAFEKSNIEYLDTGDSELDCEIMSNAFEGSDLESVYISDKIRLVGNYIFKGCEKLGTAIIGKGVRGITAEQFTGCWNLQEVVFMSSEDAETEWVDDLESQPEVLFIE